MYLLWSLWYTAEGLNYTFFRERARQISQRINKKEYEKRGVNAKWKKGKKRKERNAERRETRVRLCDCMRRCEDAIVPQPAVRRRPGATVFLSVCTEPAEADRSARTFLPFIFNVYVYSISTHFFYDGEWNSWHLKSCKSYCRLKIPIQFVRLTTRVHRRQPNANSNNSLSTHLVYSATRKFFLFLLTPTTKFPLFGRFNLYRHIVSLLVSHSYRWLHVYIFFS